VSAAVKRHSDKGNLYVVLLTNPTTGGVDASFAMLGDITLAEPGARVGFAGPRVIEKTLNQSLPKGFQKAERVMECGFIDRVVPRDKQKEVLEQILKIHSARK
jgi:acetyl-CoA carboxylase carboxyl transferase subunit beta